MSLTITIGWSLNSRTRDFGPSSFDGYQPGMPQHEEAFIIDGFDDKDPSEVAEAAFRALNDPYPDALDWESLPSLIYQAVQEAGYNGSLVGPCPNTGDGRHEWDTTMTDPGTRCRWCEVERPDLIGHYSLSVGDTVTVNGMMLACEGCGWRVVK